MTAPVDLDLAALRESLQSLLPEVGAGAALQRMTTGAGASSGSRANIVVVGEPSTGKTSMINALLGRADLLPVRPTASYVAIGGDQIPSVRAHYADGRMTSGDETHLAMLLGEGADERAERVEIMVADPRLAALTLFDTPGVGGIDSGLAQLTLSAVQQATALVFVCSAGAKISIAERKFLAEAANRIEQIVFVLSKIDKYADWEQVLAENADTIRGDFHRFPPGRFDDVVFVPISARLANMAAARGNLTLARVSGIDELWTQLFRISGMHHQLDELNTLREFASVIADAEAILADRKRTLEAAPEDDDELAAVTRQIGALTEANSAWRMQLSKQIDLARDEVRTRLRRRVSQLRDRYDAKMQEKIKPNMIPEIEAAIVSDLCELQDEIDAAVREHITEIAGYLLAGIAGGDGAVADLADQLPARGETAAEFLRERTGPPQDPSAMMMGLTTAMMGTNTARMLLTPTLAAALHVAASGFIAVGVGAVAALPVGVVWWRLQKKFRERASDVASLRGWIIECLSSANGEIALDLDRIFRQASYSLQETIASAMADALQTATEARKDLGRARDRAAADLLRLNKVKTQLDPLKEASRMRRAALLAGPTSGAG
ncbi:dynamin family protein [Mycobacterium sp. AZCC_0083]|uniref:dynamin family protein n=1 Tax=Mycobacterium sp. AZCC_0083 TaxID=2735882 RepID=UPI00161D6665|nr:dynamin family protein [Mycobacterium sp. AZCC_0083]MBB5166982.1 GTPase SAR1 family protein [Mycobacterium sp. AZCC_0083]